MSFLWPSMLFFLAAIPLGVALYTIRERNRRQRLLTLGAFGGGAAPAGQGPGRRALLRRRIPGALLVAGLVILVFALARPQSVVSVPRFEATVILAFDVSGSMAADDVEPTRIEAAKAAARAYVARQPPSVAIGIVAFSDSGFSTLTPTTDENDVLAAIDRLGPERGTSVGRGIVSSLAAIAAAEQDPEAGFYSDRSPEPIPLPPVVPPGTHAPAAIVLLSDGENNQQPDPLEAAVAAGERGIRIYSVGIGTAEGTTLEVEGFMVHSRLDEPMLRRVAEVTGGDYFAADDPGDLARIYDTIETRLVMRSEAMEVTSIVAGAGVLVLLVASLAGLLWVGRVP